MTVSDGAGVAAVGAPAAWADLVSAALLGTERRPYDGSAVPGPLAGVVPPGDLLGAAGALWVYLEAGRVPATAGPPRDATAGPAPMDGRPLLPAGAVAALDAVLRDRRFAAVLPEWLRLAERHGGRLPPERVPAVLDASPAASRGPARAVGGPVAAWLAGHNPAWAWAARPAARGGDDEPEGRTDDVLAALAGGRALVDVVDRLGARPAPWGEALSEAAVAGVRACIASGDLAAGTKVRESLRGVALAADPSVTAAADELPAALELVPHARLAAARLLWHGSLASLSVVLHFRRAMHDAFR